MNNSLSSEAQAERRSADAELCRRVADGDSEAANEFYEKYHRLARYFGRIAATQSRTGVVDEDDMSQEMYIYMLRNARKYEGDRGATFAGYIGVYARQWSTSLLDSTQYTVRLPQHIQDTVRTIERMNSDRASKRRPFMSDEEIAETFGVSLYAESPGTSVADIRRAMLLTRQMGSIDSGFNPRDMHSSDDPYIYDERNPLMSVGANEVRSTEDEVMQIALKDDLERVLGVLGEREAMVLKLRFGIDQDREWTLDEVRVRLGVSKERIRQIEARALEKLRMPKLQRQLKPHLNRS